ncbi:MAG: glycoside hydrolase family 2 protein [Clostridia bacterium]|nr:glycoside hydrolase family 2 protein [Clostridia bacterium]
MRHVYNLNHKWAFTKMATEIPSEMPKNWDFVNLPHTWNAIDGQDGGNDYYRGRCFYAKSLDLQEFPASDCYYLEIRGANSSADVYLGGKHLAHHDGGYSTFRVDLTEALARENLLVIAVDNSPNQTVYPQVADFTFYGGLYRDVNLICVPKSHFDLDYFGGEGLAVTPTLVGDRADVKLSAHVCNQTAEQRVVYTVYNKEGDAIATEETDQGEMTLPIEQVHRWHGKRNPYLYTATVSLYEGSELLDSVSARFGCREFEIDPNKGFLLNGESYPLRGVSRHQDRWGIGNALSREDHLSDIDLICDLGATTVRLAHYQHDQYFYDLCDERGLVVWAEIPYISQHMPTAIDNTVSQMQELIVQNYNHPSIVVWGLSNEITMKGDRDPHLLENHRLLNDLCHKMDPTRKTVVAAVSPCPIDSPYLQIPDAVSYNHYFGWYGGDTSMNGPWFDRFHKTHPDIPIGCSEYGCEALDWHSSEPEQGDYTEEYQAYYHEELIKALFSRPYLWATHVWNMFDFGADARCEGGENGQNHKGLVTFDRKYKKDAFYAYRAWLSDDPFVHLCGKRYTDRVEEETTITVYSNLPEVELFVNGKSVGKQKAEDHFFRFRIPNQGRSDLVAVAGDCRDESFVQRVDSFPEKYRLREKGAVLNWFDITAPEGYFSLNDKVNDIFATEQGAELLGGLFAKLMPKEGDTLMGGFEMNESMMQMMGGFTLLRLSGMMGMMGVTLGKEELLSINARLNRIEKPKMQ